MNTPMTDKLKKQHDEEKPWFVFEANAGWDAAREIERHYIKELQSELETSGIVSRAHTRMVDRLADAEMKLVQSATIINKLGIQVTFLRMALEGLLNNSSSPVAIGIAKSTLANIKETE